MTEQESRVLNFEEIEAAPDQTELVDMTDHGWPGSVMIRELPGTESEEFAFEFTNWDQKDDPRRAMGQRARLIAMCLVNPQTKRPLASNKEEQDRLAEKIGKKGNSALNKLFNACMRINQFSKEAVEMIARDFPGTAEDSSSSDSPLN